MLTPPIPLRSIVNEDGAVILDISHNQMVKLNSTGGYVWDKLRQGKAVEVIVRDLSVECNADPVDVERDVHAFVEQLMSRRLLHN